MPAHDRTSRERDARGEADPADVSAAMDASGVGSKTQTIVADGGGMRFNAGKNALELMPPEWTWGLGMVLTRGAIKYASRNWERGMAWGYPVACAFRHILKFVCGERYDAETGCHHLFMAAWNCCALATYDIRGIGTNDLVGKLEWLEAVAVAPGPALQAIIDEQAAEAAAKKAA